MQAKPVVQIVAVTRGSAVDVDFSTFTGDLALYINGSQIEQAETSEEIPLQRMAESIALSLGVRVEYVTYENAAHDWEWFQVEDFLAYRADTAPTQTFTFDVTAINAEGEFEKMELSATNASPEGALERLLVDHTAPLNSLPPILELLNSPINNPPAYITRGNTIYTCAKGSANTPDNAADAYLNVIVGNLSVQIKREREGVVIDVFPVNDVDQEPVASAYAFYDDGVVV